MPAFLAALGAQPGGVRAERLRQSPHYRDGAFHNTTPTRMLRPGEAARAMRAVITGRRTARPTGPIPIVRAAPAGAPTHGVDLTWYGHATVLVEIEGRRVLLDPVWSERCSPVPSVGPKRLHPMPVALADLPPLDAIVVSHDHYDHLDLPTVRALARLQQAPFLVPLGVGAHLELWGVPANRIVELDWDEDVDVAGLALTATEARHFSGRGLRRDSTLWSSWVIKGEHHRIFYTGDSGYFDGYAAIGERHGPFDASLIQVGAYNKAWPDIHMTPEEAVRAHRDVRGDLLIPVHWGTFTLAPHAWAEPVDRLWAEARARDVRLAVPRPGQRVDVLTPQRVDPWWQILS